MTDHNSRRGECQMLIIDKTIVTVGRKWRSKWWKIACHGCSISRRRKDGTCRHERTVMDMVTPELQNRVRFGD